MKRHSPRNNVIVFFVLTALIVLSLVLFYNFKESLAAFIQSMMSEHMVELASPDNILQIIKLILWGALGVMVVRALSAFVFDFIFRLRRGREAPNLVRNIFSISAYILLFFFIFKTLYPKIDLAALFTTSAIFGVIIGLALQDTLGNLFAGISLHADNPFQVGDVIVVGKNTGVVEGITWRAVKIRTFQNHIILLSNSSVAKESIEVCPRDNLNARIVHFNALYTDSPAKTIHIVREAVREADNVSDKITPVVRIRDFGESSVDYEVKYWLVDYSKYNDTDALVRQRIWYAFRRAGLSFAFPTRTLILERKSKDGLRADGNGFVERLSAVDIFAPLTAEELAQLAGASASHVFAPGEMVIRAGEEGSSMFVVHNGKVGVQVSENGRPRTVAVLKEGDFFGEMALFTGEPRTANVVAMEETEVLEIGHQAMKHLFETNPDLVESLGRIIAERREGLVATPEELRISRDPSAGVLASIKRFFGLK